MSTRDGSLSVLVCRGCCCGTQDGIDHDRHLQQLTEVTTANGGDLRVTNCIGPCDRKNVVVVRAREPIARWRSFYFRAVGDDEVAAIAAWLPNFRTALDPPTVLQANVFRWPLSRAELLGQPRS